MWQRLTITSWKLVDRPRHDPPGSKGGHTNSDLCPQFLCISQAPAVSMYLTSPIPAPRCSAAVFSYDNRKDGCRNIHIPGICTPLPPIANPYRKGSSPEPGIVEIRVSSPLRAFCYRLQPHGNRSERGDLPPARAHGVQEHNLAYSPTGRDGVNRLTV